LKYGELVVMDTALAHAIDAIITKQLVEEHIIPKLLALCPDANILFVQVVYTPAIVASVQHVMDVPVM
jgi:hypothetical protein